MQSVALGAESQTIYYVAPNGSDSDRGTSGAPFRTIQKAADMVNPGDTVIVKNGIYTDTNGDGRIVNLKRGGTSSAWITFRAENKWGAVLDGQNYATDFCWVNSHNASHVKIEEFEMKGCVKAINNNSMNHDIFIHRNYIHDIGRVMAGDKKGRSAVFAGRGTYNFTVDSNLFHTIGRLNPYTTPSAPESSCAVNGTLHCYQHDHALYLYGRNHTIVNNIFFDLKSGWAIQISGGTGMGDGPNWNICNNTFEGANPKKKGQIVIWRERGGQKISQVTVQNNISYNARGAFVFMMHGAGGAEFRFSNNLVYGNKKMSLVSGIGMTPDYTSSGNIIDQDPLFADVPKKDFHLQRRSPAIDAGQSDHAPLRDIDRRGRPEGKAVDIGAYEYSSDAK